MTGIRSNNEAPPIIPNMLSFVMGPVSMIGVTLDLFRHPQRESIRDGDLFPPQ
jgi:hypothetical protein